LRGKQHKEFAKNDSNYSSLDKAINEGPKIEDLKEIHFKKSRSSDNSPVLKKSTASARYLLIDLYSVWYFTVY
jgi:hypothetical protein